MNVLAQQDLAVTLYIPDADVRPSQHSGAQVTSYVAANGSGDVSAEETATPFTGTTTSMWWLKAIDVSSSSSTGAIVAFGDSITDGTCSTVDAHDRWVDLLAVRLALDAASHGSTGRAQGRRQRGHRGQHRHAREASTAARQSAWRRTARSRRAESPRGHACHLLHGHQRHSP